MHNILRKQAVAVLFAAFSVGTLCFGIAFPNAARAASSGVFGGGPFYNNAASHINEIKNSGFNEVVVWNIEVKPNGDLNFNGEFPLCSNGTYIGVSTHPDFAGNMASLKQGTVRRITFSVGSSNYGDFEDVRDLVNAQGTGPGSILYRNFQALKTAIPALDSIDFDDENCYDQSTMTSFAVMLGGLGYTVALDPYTNRDFWTSVAAQINTERPGTVDLVHLQCYSGGAGNDPVDWNFGGISVQPSVDSNSDSPSATQSQMAYWRGEAGSTGGWMWLYDQFVGNAASYARAINVGIGGPTALSAAGGSGSVALSWTSAAGGGTYNVYRGTSAGGENAVPIKTGVSGTRYTDSSVPGGATYYYKVTSGTASGEAAPANEAFAFAAPALPTISGTVSLQGTASGRLAQPLVFTLTPTGATGGSVTSQTLTTAADGSFSLTTAASGTYMLSVKGSKWLRRSVPVNTTSGNVSGLTISLLGGDMNGDNHVSFADFIVLRNAYGSSPGKANWNPNADLNNDGQVTQADFLIFQSNYGKTGNP